MVSSTFCPSAKSVAGAYVTLYSAGVPVMASALDTSTASMRKLMLLTSAPAPASMTLNWMTGRRAVPTLPSAGTRPVMDGGVGSAATSCVTVLSLASETLPDVSMA